jgi:putative transposase
LIQQEESSPVSVRRQSELLSLNRSSFYYEPEPVSPKDQAVMNQIDEIYTKCPFYGARKILKDSDSLLDASVRGV